MRALAPSVLLLVFAFACGTLVGGTGGVTTLVGHALILAFAAWGAYAWRDPLRLGRKLAWLAWAPLAIALLSDLVSPVSRAGWTGLALAPAFLFLPAAVDRCWREGEARVGATGVALTVLAVSSWALVTLFSKGLSRAALPLGHHNLLAAFLVPLLPLAAAILVERDWRRWFGLLAVVLGVTAILATRSLDAAAALVVESIAIGVLWKRARPWALATVVLAALVALPRVPRVLAGSDPSLQARATYAEAGLDGIALRPLLGWGPGSVPWTVSMNLKPRLGVNPASQVIGDLHSLPLQWTYETGLAGLAALLALGWFFARARRREGPSGASDFERRCVLVGAAGLLVVTLSNSQVEVVALPLMAAVLVGVWMAEGSDREWRELRQTSKWRWGLLLLVVGALALLPMDLAHLSYDWAHRSVGDTQVRRLAWATHLDPRFPLYRFRLALALERSQPQQAAKEALAAATRARGVAPLWLEAGLLARKAGLASGTEALVAACRLDRLAPLPPFFAALSSPDDRRGAELLAHALALEPRLAAAMALDNRGSLIDAARARILETRQLPLRWRIDLERSVALARSQRSDARSAHLVLDADQESYLSFSVYAFRRSPWPARLASVILRRSGVDVMSSVPRLDALPGLPRSLGRALSCGSD